MIAVPLVAIFRYLFILFDTPIIYIFIDYQYFADCGIYKEVSIGNKKVGTRWEHFRENNTFTKGTIRGT